MYGAMDSERAYLHYKIQDGDLKTGTHFDSETTKQQLLISEIKAIALLLDFSITISTAYITCKIVKYTVHPRDEVVMSQ
jgi:hypothetical protein